jgi:anti-sigma B factor antagonist
MQGGTGAYAMNQNQRLIINHQMKGQGSHTLSLTGDLDVSTAPTLRKFIDRMIREGNVNLTLDLSKLSYLDSSGYVAIVDATRKTKATSGRLDVANMPRWMTEFFDLSVLDGENRSREIDAG